MTRRSQFIRKFENLEVKSLVPIFISLSLVVFSLWVVVDILGNLEEAFEKGEIVTQQEEKVAQLRLQNLAKQQELEYVMDDTYVEKEARERFNYIKDGEVVFYLPETGEVAGVNDSNSEEIDDRVSPFEEWMQLIF